MITSRILDPVIVTLLFAILTETKPAAPLKSRNLLFSEPGVVAVYIRPGDTPLEDISQDLAEAFDFNAAKHGRLAFGRQINEILSEKERNGGSINSHELAEGESYNLTKKKIGKNHASSSANEEQTHIQRIPKQ